MRRGAREGIQAQQRLSEPLSLRIPSDPGYVMLARLVVSHIARVAGFGPEETYDLKLAVTEAATNVIRHAAVDHFEIEYRILPEAVQITVTDAGGGFDIEETGGSPDGYGGFGLAVIRHLVDEMVVDSAPDGTRLRMIRRRGASVEEASNG